MEKSICFFTRIDPKKKRTLLYKGTLFAVLGAGILLFTGIYLPLPDLNRWGLFLFFLAFMLIRYGLLPYKKLTRLELFPDTLILSNLDLQYQKGGKPTFSIPLYSIATITFQQTGVGVILKRPIREKIQLQNPRFSIIRMRKKSQKSNQVDFFFEHFDSTIIESWKKMS